MNHKLHSPAFASSKHRTSYGFTLTELLVAMVLGLFVVATLLSFFSPVNSARRQAIAQSEMNEDGLYALQILSSQIRIAGYNPLRPPRNPPAGTTVDNPNPLYVSAGAGFTGRLALFACDTGFANNTTSTASIQNLTCNATGSTATHAIAVTYEIDNYNAVNTAANFPTDCAGNTISPNLQVRDSSGVDWGTQWRYAENRFYLSNNSLLCSGNGGTPSFSASSQPLVENVEEMRFRFGVAVPSSASVTSTTATFQQNVAGYLSASQIGGASGLGSDTTYTAATLQTVSAERRWGSVISVQICVLMRSATQVLNEPQSYLGCDTEGAEPITPNDRFMRRAYYTTVNLRNRISTD